MPFIALMNIKSTADEARLSFHGKPTNYLDINYIPDLERALSGTDKGFISSLSIEKMILLRKS